MLQYTTDPKRSIITSPSLQPLCLLHSDRHSTINNLDYHFTIESDQMNIYSNYKRGYLSHFRFESVTVTTS